MNRKQASGRGVLAVPEIKQGGRFMTAVEAETTQVVVLKESERMPFSDSDEFARRFPDMVVFLVKQRETYDGDDIVVAAANREDYNAVTAKFLEAYPDQRESMACYRIRHGRAVFENMARSNDKDRLPNGRSR
jgi:hypothetical protein